MSWTLIADVASGANNSPTSPSIDTTGANLIVVVTNGFTADGTFTDNKSNTWTQIGTNQTPASDRSSFWYAFNPTVGSGHTFTGNGFDSICAQAWSGAATSPLDQHAQAIAAQAGSITPGQSGELIIAANGPLDTQSVSSIDSGFTLQDNFAYVTGTYEGTAMAYLVQGSAAAINPTWTMNAAGTPASFIASFKGVAPSFVPYNPWPQQAPILAQ